MKLSEGIEIYVSRKQANGVGYCEGTKVLLSFRRSVGDPPLDAITCQQILGFLERPGTSTTSWRKKYSVLSHFFEYWISREQMPSLFLPPARAPEPTKFVPFIYTKTEIHTLLETVQTTQRHEYCSVDVATMRTALLTLYATGASVSEILELECRDIDLHKGFLTIRSRQFSRSRRLPVNCDLLDQLRKYLALRRDRFGASGYLFLNRFGKPISPPHLTKRFQILRRACGIERNSEVIYQPRMHDFRATFAVHRITFWIRTGADLNRMLPALAAYMGHVGLTSTERFLALTPERFRSELDKLSPRRGRSHWRNNRRLMEFLDHL
jgi:integrase/recombinase XerD